MSYHPNIPSHRNGDKCPACSGEKDKGGRLTLRVSKFKTHNGFVQFWLTCSNCLYSINSYRTQENSLKPQERMNLAKALYRGKNIATTRTQEHTLTAGMVS